MSSLDHKTVSSSAGEIFTDTAWAKVNLTLKVLGKRADGYHELQSLVVFAGCGDKLRLSVVDEAALLTALDCNVEGPEAQAIEGENLVEEVSHHFFEWISKEGVLNLSPISQDQLLATGKLFLDKRLPVAAGLGGGSADAAAALRLISEAMKLRGVDLSSLDLHKFALRFGADIPVCLNSVPSFMTGIGETVTPLTQFPKLGLLLVNPRVPVPTGQVFQELNAAPLKGDAGHGHGGREKLAAKSFCSVSDVIDYMNAFGNDLLEPALKVAPQIGNVLAEIESQEGCLISRLSGSGATCFGLFETLCQAEHAGEILKNRYPEWWIESTFVRPLDATCLRHNSD